MTDIYILNSPIPYHVMQNYILASYDLTKYYLPKEIADSVKPLVLIHKAKDFAIDAHQGQKRKYTGTPYSDHPIRVAEEVWRYRGSTYEMVVAAYLHDVVEDCNVTLDEIEERFGPTVRMYVDGLSNKTKKSNLSREERKRLDREWLQKQCKEVHIIKMIDRIDNLKEMTAAPVDFKIKYSKESLLLADAIGKSCPILEQSLRTEAARLIGE